MKGKVCLVTGAAGFIGSHLLRRLLGEGAIVHAMVRPASGSTRLQDIEGEFTRHALDLRDGEAVRHCLAEVRPQKVFHLAAETRDTTADDPASAARSLDGCIDPLANLLQPLSQATHPPEVVVRAGSIAEYGKSPLPFREEQREYPTTPYGLRMLAATHLCEMLDARLPFPVHTARLALTYGEGQARTFLIPALVAACRRGERTVIRRPDDRRDLIHVDDVVDALLMMATGTDKPGTTVNIATGVAPSMREVAGHVVAMTGCEPSLVAIKGGSAAGGQPSVLVASPEKAGREFGWSAKIALEEGLRMLIGTRATDRQGALLRHG